MPTGLTFSTSYYVYIIMSPAYLIPRLRMVWEWGKLPLPHVWPQCNGAHLIANSVYNTVSFPGHSHIFYACGCRICNSGSVLGANLCTYPLFISEFKLTHIYIRFKIIIPAVVYTSKKIIFWAGVHWIYKQKPKVLSGYCSNNCKMYKLVEFHKHM